MLSESKGQNKTAKLWFKTNDIENRDTYEIFKKFLSSIKDKQMEKIIKMYKSEPNIEIKFPVIMQDLNETDDEYRKRIRKYMEQ